MKITDYIPCGRENAISNDDLAVQLDTDKRTARAMVFAARINGDPICSTCKGRRGYYLPTDANEALIYLRQQIARIKSARAALRDVRKFLQDKERS